MSTSDEEPPTPKVNDFTDGSASSIYDEIYDATDYKTSYYSDVRVNQYAQAVIDFSSQYGSDYSISYTALNITGRPSKFPDYGDFPETFAMVSLPAKRKPTNAVRFLDCILHVLTHVNNAKRHCFLEDVCLNCFDFL